MPPRTKVFQNCIIAYTDGISVEKRDKIKGWVEHASGRVSKELAQNVTHLVLTKQDWDNYRNRPMVTQARRRKTIYLMRLSWLEDSILLNKCTTKPLNECDKKYNWEVSHGRKVMRHRERQKRQLKKEKLRKIALAAQEDQVLFEADTVDSEEGEDLSSQATICNGWKPPMSTGDEGNKDLGSGSTVQSTRERSDERTTHEIVGTNKSRAAKAMLADKLRQISESGIKFDKALLETERDMALAGYRPYIGTEGVVHFITLLRKDVENMIREEYTLKSSIGLPGRQDRHSPIKESYRPSFTQAPISKQRRRRKWRNSGFKTGENTDLRYLEDAICCYTSTPPCHVGTDCDRLNDGQCTPLSFGGPPASAMTCGNEITGSVYPQQPAVSAFQQWEQHVPFSLLPVTSYNSFSDTYAKSLVHLPRPFAYALQLYESFDRQPPYSEHEDSSVSLSISKAISPRPTPEISTSFTDYLPTPGTVTRDSRLQSVPNHTQPATNSIAQSTAPDEQSNVCASSERRYAVICQYTKKGKPRASEVFTLAPENSTFDFAIDIFRKFFKRKTGIEWEVAMRGNETTNLKDLARNDVTRSLEIEIPEDAALGPNAAMNETQHSCSDSVFLDTSGRKFTGNSSDQANKQTPRASAQDERPEDPPNATGTWLNRPALITDGISTGVAREAQTPKNLSQPGNFRPFKYVPSDRKVFDQGNKKYKAQYGENLFCFPHK